MTVYPGRTARRRARTGRWIALGVAGFVMAFGGGGLRTGQAQDSLLSEGAGAIDPLNDLDPGALEASLETQTEARTFTLVVPAPRGQILDRNGYPLAQTKVSYYAAINFPYLGDSSDAEVLRFAQARILTVNRLLGTNWDVNPDSILAHYTNRRWLPLTFSSLLTDAQVERLKPEIGDGVLLHPVYMRHYPRNQFASHILGYVGKRPPPQTGPIGEAEPLWGDAQGVEGIEESFDQDLTGQPGRVQLLFDADGTKLSEETLRRPIPGHNIVLSLDVEMQALAEKVLSENAKRGAFVIMDVRNGDIMAMASWPQFDPNLFIPAISQLEYQRLQTDPEKPLFGRAFRAAYPPASTFKVPVALGLLESGAVTQNSYFSCPTSYQIGDRVFHNWNKDGEGSMNVVTALTRSCNTWFYQAAIQAGVDPITSMARQLGFGEKTGLPLKAETAGFLPTNEWSWEKYGHQILNGDLANMAIGQGTVLASPLQVAQAMASVGSRERNVHPRLVLQVQDVNNRVTKTFQPREGNALEVDPYNLELVVKGMENVVNSWNGTGRSAGHEALVVAGKTGTGQWKPVEEQNIAWFAGFAPADYPVYAFAVVYEGEPGEKVGGGRTAGPIVGTFFEEYLTEDRLAQMKSAVEALELAAGDSLRERPEVDSIFEDPKTAARYEEVSNEQPKAEEESGGLFRWFRRFRGR